jgi:hypothetical protein
MLEKLEEQAQSPQRITMQALQSAHAIWIKRYPEWEATFFDEHFLHNHVIPHFTAGQLPNAETLTEAWVIQLGATADQAAELMTDLTPVAVDFLYVVKSERCFFLDKAERKYRALRWVVALLSGNSQVRRIGNLS